MFHPTWSSFSLVRTLAHSLGRRPLAARQRSRRPVRPDLQALEERWVPTLLGQQLFPLDSSWNQSIAVAPVATNSSAVINQIVSLYGDRSIHPDFGENTATADPLYGIPFNVVHGNSQPKVSVVIDAYPDESDLPPVPIPANAVIEGDFRDGPRQGVDERGDSHLLIYDVDNNIGYELYRASRPNENSDGRWHADQLSVWDYSTNSFRALGWTSADAAGLPILPGLARPDEGLPVDQGGQGVIRHPIRFTLRNNLILNKYIYPASHTANPGNTNAAVQPPMGARFRLKPDVDISQLNPQARIIAQAMKDYGLILADNGSNFFFSGASFSVDASNRLTLTWNDDDIQDSTRGLKSLKYSQFEMVDLTPVVASLNPSSAAAGSTVTVVGQNFGGAAGRLSVLFGSVVSTSVTVVDNRHLSVVVPASATAGAVDVRVQSGVSAPGNSGNLKEPIFGYGLSAVSPGGRFTYAGGAVNQPPRITTTATATPNPVTGVATTLSVTAVDDGGEASLRYTWSVLAAPAGATPVFGVNGVNAAKSTVATFNRAGVYTFQVTAADVPGLTATSATTVTVNARLSRLVVSPASVTLRRNARQRFSALALDQFGVALATQPPVTWSKASGIGRISTTGLYTAPNRTGSAVIRARAGGLSATAAITVIR